MTSPKKKPVCWVSTRIWAFGDGLLATAAGLFFLIYPYLMPVRFREAGAPAEIKVPPAPPEMGDAEMGQSEMGPT